jgi:DNA-binding Lrp family transcriptional regulator
MEKIDKLDKKILNILQKDCSLNTKEIAEVVGLSTTPVYERIKKMENKGVIKSYVALVDNNKVGKTLVAYCNVSLQLHSTPLLKKFELAMSKFPEIIECYHIAGSFDYLLKIIVDDMNHYQDFIKNGLASLDNIAHAQSSFVMTEVKHSTAIKL